MSKLQFILSFLFIIILLFIFSTEIIAQDTSSQPINQIEETLEATVKKILEEKEIKSEFSEEKQLLP